MSFDDGDQWQPLQLNLPHTSMRDLTIHGADLVVGTHGRGFWILDDITPLREMAAELSRHSNGIFFSEGGLVRPEMAWRFRRDRATDTPLPPEVPAGKNPPDGAIIDYYLKDAVSGPVTLEILDARGEVVRKYASTDAPIDMAATAKENPIPMYWVQQPQILPATAGMHRFVWDLHYTAPASLEHDYPISAIPHDTPREPEGARALPGRYTVRLSAAGKSWTQALTVKMDPRIKATPEELAQQFAVELDAVRGMNESFAELRTIQALRGQLKDRAEKAGKGALGDAIGALDKKAEQLAGAARPAFFGTPPTGKEKENLSTLNQHFRGLLHTADSCDCAPTAQATAVWRELQMARTALAAETKAVLEHDVPAVNQQLQKAGLAPLSTKPVSGSDQQPDAQEDED